MTGPAPTLEPRSAEALAAALHGRIGGYLPGWQPAPGGPGDALLAISGTLLRALAERVNAAPEKNRLAFLDLLGLELLPAQAARAPVVFEVAAGGGDGAVPAGTRLGATRPGGGDPIGFETEVRVMLTAAQLAEVASLWPGRDEWADHSADAAAGRPFTPFAPLVPVPHALYLSSARQLALAGRSVVELDVGLEQAGSEALALAWEYWDGKAWRPLGEGSEDGTRGLTRSGVIRLTADCATSVPRLVDGVDGHWLRGRLDAPLVHDQTRTLPTIDTLRVRSVNEQLLPANTCAGGLSPDAAYGEGQRLDVTKTFRPLGMQPEPGATLLLSLATAFDRPGAQVTVCLERPVTAAEQADLDTDTFSGQVNAAAAQLEKALKQAREVVTILDTLALGKDPIPSFDDWPAFQAWLALAEQRLDAVLASLKTAVQQTRLFTNTGWAGALLTPHVIHEAAKDKFPMVAQALAQAISQLAQPNHPVQTLAATTFPLTGDQFVGSFVALQTTMLAATPPSFLAGLSVQDVRRDYDAIVKRITDSRDQVATALIAAKEVVRLLEHLDPSAIAVHQGAPRPTPPPPELAWEYFDGVAWAALPALGGPAAARNLAASGRVTFDVPDDWEPTDIDGEPARWARIRLVRGVFGRLEIVSWRDGDTGEIKHLPVTQPRPPELDALTVGYRSAPPAEPPDRCLVHHDFEWSDRSAEARWPGGAFAPFAPVADRTPALYLGFDGVVPPGTLGLYLDVEERPTLAAPALDWEYHDGGWRPLAVSDGTRGLSETGLVLVQWPGAGAGGLARFGTSRTWIRARLRTDAAPPRVTIRRVAHNAAPAAQLQTVRDEVLGPLTAAPGQAVVANRTPVLPGQAIELRERTGARAHVEQEIVLHDVVTAGGDPDDVRVVRDRRSGRVREVWVRWHERPTLLFSGPDARHYTIERTRGRIAFGDGVHGRVPPPAADGLRVTYQTSEGAAGNVPAGAIATLLGATPAAAVVNPAPAEGGADGEPEAAVLARGADVLRHRRQALSLADYEALAREASPAVALARALPARRPGAIRLAIAPRSPDAEPQPTRELRRRVREFVSARMPATAGRQLAVEGPRYLRVGVTVAVAPAPGAAGDAVIRAVKAALAAFLHPLASDRPFGRDVDAAAVAAVVGAVEGVEQTRTLALLVDGAAVGDRVAVPADRIACAGGLDVTLAEGEG